MDNVYFSSCISLSGSLGVNNQSTDEVKSGVVMNRTTEFISYGEKQGGRDKYLAFRIMVTNLKPQLWHFLVIDPCQVILPPVLIFSNE